MEAIYARSRFYHKEKVVIGIFNNPVNWRNNRANVDGILFIIAIL